MKRITLIFALAATVASWSAIAQDAGDTNAPGPMPPPHHRPPPPPIIVALDANHDGIIDANEIANAPAALRTLDKNGDGQLTPDEYLMPPRGQKEHRRPPPPPLFEALDTNHDGVIDENEMANAPAALKALENNGSSKITLEEACPPPPPPPPPREEGNGADDKQ